MGRRYEWRRYEAKQFSAGGIVRVVSWGGGINSTAMVIGMLEREEWPGVILFADTLGEKPETYDYLGIFDKWVRRRTWGGLGVTYVANGERSVDESLEAEVLRNRTLPALAFGWRSCSDKWKRRPQEQWLKDRGYWVPGLVKVIGFGAEEKHRADRAVDEFCKLEFPLIEWGWDREKCVEVIKAAGLPIPVKSACFFCPAMTKPEILDLRVRHPELYARARAMEENADKEKLREVKGLGRHWNWGEVDEKVCLPVVEQTCMCFDGEE